MNIKMAEYDRLYQVTGVLWQFYSKKSKQVKILRILQLLRSPYGCAAAFKNSKDLMNFLY